MRAVARSEEIRLRENGRDETTTGEKSVERCPFGRVLADRLEHGGAGPDLVSVSFRAAQHVAQWPSTRARRVLAALARIGWTVKRTADSYQVLSRDG